MDDNQFQQTIRSMPEPVDGDPPDWNAWRYSFWAFACSNPIRQFMSWPAVYHTMLFNHVPGDKQFDALQRDWRRWEPVVRADPQSGLVDFWPDKRYSRSMVEQAYNLHVWELIADKRVEDLGSIFEFGGGYGALALVVHRLGFTGSYAIFDLPEFALLQDWFLSQHDIQVRHTLDMPDRADDVDLFVACCSLSEIPYEMRNTLLNRVRADSYLLLYSDTRGEYDNVGYFQGFMGKTDEHRWLQIPQLDGRQERYAVGWRG